MKSVIHAYAGLSCACIWEHVSLRKTRVAWNCEKEGVGPAKDQKQI